MSADAAPVPQPTPTWLRPLTHKQASPFVDDQHRCCHTSCPPTVPVSRHVTPPNVTRDIVGHASDTEASVERSRVAGSPSALCCPWPSALCWPWHFPGRLAAVHVELAARISYTGTYHLETPTTELEITRPSSSSTSSSPPRQPLRPCCRHIRLLIRCLPMLKECWPAQADT